jgi:ATP-dependent Clp protease ATP-binding subunit ClpA
VTTFGSYVHTIIEQGGHEARTDGSATIEAHHLLLAVAAQEGTTAHQVLTSVGLDRQAIREALDREFEHSLSAVGVSRAAFDLPEPSSDPERSARIGASAKLALERGVAAAARKKDLESAHLLLGILEASAGIVPRALDLVGIDRVDLAARVRRAHLETAGGST